MSASSEAFAPRDPQMKEIEVLGDADQDVGGGLDEGVRPGPAGRDELAPRSRRVRAADRECPRARADPGIAHCDQSGSSPRVVHHSSP